MNMNTLSYSRNKVSKRLYDIGFFRQKIKEVMEPVDETTDSLINKIDLEYETIVARIEVCSVSKTFQEVIDEIKDHSTTNRYNYCIATGDGVVEYDIPVFVIDALDDCIEEELPETASDKDRNKTCYISFMNIIPISIKRHHKSSNR